MAKTNQTIAVIPTNNTKNSGTRLVPVQVEDGRLVPEPNPGIIQ